MESGGGWDEEREELQTNENTRSIRLFFFIVLTTIRIQDCSNKIKPVEYFVQRIFCVGI